MDPITIAVIGVAAFLVKLAAIIIAAWIFTELCQRVGRYLRDINREIGLMYKRHAIDELISAARDADIQCELRRIRDKHQGLIIPLDTNDNPVQGNIRVVSAKECSRDDVSDKVVIADDDSGCNR